MPHSTWFVPLLKRVRHNHLREYTSCMTKLLASYREYATQKAPDITLTVHLRLLHLMPRLLLRHLPSNVNRMTLFDDFRAHNFQRLLEAALAARVDDTSNPRGPPLYERIQELVKDRRLRVANQCLEAHPHSAHTTDTVSILESKFPSRKQQVATSVSLRGDPLEVTPAEVFKAASNVNLFSGTGPSSLSMYTLVAPLRAADQFEDIDEYAELLAFYATNILNGETHTRSSLTVTKLLALPKPNGGIRPVNIPEATRRFFSRIFSNRFLPEIRAALSPIQLGVAKNGTGTAIHTLRAHLDKHSDSFALCLDFANAFNEVTRAQIRRSLTDTFPRLLPFFDLFHQGATEVYFHHIPITADEGTLQGDTWGGLFFAIAIQPVLVKLQTEFPEFKLQAYFDDISIMGRSSSAERLSQFLTTFAEEFFAIGLQLNLGKCQVYAHRSDLSEWSCWSVLSSLKASLSPELPMRHVVMDPQNVIQVVPPQRGLVFLGTPIGHPSWVAQELDKKLRDAQHSLDRLVVIKDLPQQFILILRHCVINQMDHLARTVPPSILRPTAQRFDFAVRKLLRSLLPQLPPPEDKEAYAYTVFRLPAKFGGLALPSLEHKLEAAYVSSLCASIPTLERFGLFMEDVKHCCISLLGKFVPMIEAVPPRSSLTPEVLSSHAATRSTELFQLFGNLDYSDPVWSNTIQGITSFWDQIYPQLARTPHMQNILTRVQDSYAYDTLLSEIYSYTGSDNRHRCARFISRSCREAVLWSISVPTCPQLTLSPQEYRYLMAYALDLPLPGRSLMPPKCSCKRFMDTKGYHVLSCWRPRVHDRTVRELHSFARSAGLVSVLEPRNTCQGDLRPDLAVSGLCDNGKTLLLDFTTTDPTSLSAFRNQSYNKFNAAAIHAEKLKTDKYTGKFNAQEFSFTPLCMELSGRWSAKFHSVFRSIKKFAVQSGFRSNCNWPQYINYWRQRIGVQFAKNLAATGFSIATEITSGLNQSHRNRNALVHVL